MVLNYNSTHEGELSMGDVQMLWDLEDDPDGNVQHIAANGVTVEEYVEVFAANYAQATISRESGRPICFGFTSDGKALRGCLG
jgi:hypothetical protein